MKTNLEKVPIERYLGIDLHKEYVMIGGQNKRQEWVLRPRKIQMRRFRDWAAKNLRPGDAVVIETTGNVWDIYDIVAPLVSKAVVAHARKMRQIAEARVKTDKEDIKRLITLLIADIVPEVWVPPMHVRELRSLISFRWRVNKQIVMSKNRLHSVIQRFNLTPPEGKILADKNMSWWEEQEFSELTAFQVEMDLSIIKELEAQKAAIDQKLAEMSNSEPWASDMVYLMQIPGFGIIYTVCAYGIHDCSVSYRRYHSFSQCQETGWLFWSRSGCPYQRQEISGKANHERRPQGAPLGDGGSGLGRCAL